MEEILDQIASNDRETVRVLLSNDVQKTGEKLLYLKTYLQDKTLLAKCLFLFNQKSKEDSLREEPKLERVYYPVQRENEILPRISEDVREEVKTVLGEETLTIEEKFECLKDILTETGDIKECRKFLKYMKAEDELLEMLPESARPDVVTILIDSKLSMDGKRELLRLVLKKPEERKICRRYLRKKNIPEVVCSAETEDTVLYGRDFWDKMPDTMNILILGETGVGKSTFINGLANYLNYRNLYEAKDEGPIVLIKSYFTQTGNDNQPVKIVCSTTVEGEDDDNENLENGLSSTLKTKCYQFIWGPSGKKKTIRLIDTPGAGDVQGLRRDTENFADIFSFIADFKEINAVCILLKPNESKLSVNFRYTLGELFSRLHVSARRNILFCFNNTRGTLYKPGETIATLQAYIKDLEKARDIQIPLNRSSLFCFDNESFRFLCAVQKGIRFSDKLFEDFDGSWQVSVKETFRFFQRVSQLPVHNVDETLCVSNVRSVLDSITRPMVDLIRAKRNIQRVMFEKWQKIESCEKEIREVKTTAERRQMITSRVESGRFDVVCVNAKCTQPDPHSATEKVYAVCHRQCDCCRPKLHACQDPKIQQCSIIDKNTLLCTSCGCQWQCHMQVNTELKTAEQQIIDSVNATKIDILEMNLKRLNEEVAKQREEKDDLEKENEKLMSYGNDFIAFLNKDAILPYNRNFAEYVERMIAEEKYKVGLGAPEKELLWLEEVRERYEQQVHLLRSSSTTAVRESTGFEELVSRLQQDRSCSVLQKNLQKVLSDWLRVRSKPMNRNTRIKLNSGWIGSLYK